MAVKKEALPKEVGDRRLYFTMTNFLFHYLKPSLSIL